MKISLIHLECALALGLAVVSPLWAVGGRGGGGHGGGGHAGGGHAGGARPGGGHAGGMSRPSAPSRPAPQMSRPAPRPSTPVARPSQPVRPSTPSRPSGGSTPHFGGNTPRPSFPTTRPGTPGTRPQTPGRPEFAGRPDFNRPDFNRPDAARPGTRPTPGNVSDFLGIPGGLKPGEGGRPERPGTLPGVRPGEGIARPERPGDRPGPRPDGRPDVRPGVRPGEGGPRPNRPDLNRPNNIYNRPSWANIDNNKINNINNNIHNVINTRPARPGQGMNNWIANHPNRGQYWNHWGHGVHCPYPPNRPWFGPGWWNHHGGPNCGWHYHYWNRPWRYWWTVPVWGGVTSWFSNWGWQEPVYYDYGQGGNVYYQDNTVYMNQQPIASAEEYAQSAAALATVEPPKDEAQAEQTEWMPLGTFTLSIGEDDKDPARVLQLAVSKAGIVSGTLYNRDTDKSYAIQGQVDKQTQRVAFRIGESDKIVAETGIYNLTQQEAPLLIHFGTEKTETWLLVRLPEPSKDEGDGTTEF